tara:strand:- start:126 stop:308 length:183 start_codon:yes stop_codon:yes gene_type:complete
MTITKKEFNREDLEMRIERLEYMIKRFERFDNTQKVNSLSRKLRVLKEKKEGRWTLRKNK